MKYIIHVIFGSIIVALGISHLAFKYAHKNIPPSVIGMTLIIIYMSVASFFEKKSE
jgi:membrane-bound ClpP family serine protease